MLFIRIHLISSLLEVKCSAEIRCTNVQPIGERRQEDHEHLDKNRVPVCKIFAARPVEDPLFGWSDLRCADAEYYISLYINLKALAEILKTIKSKHLMEK